MDSTPRKAGQIMTTETQDNTPNVLELMNTHPKIVEAVELFPVLDLPWVRWLLGDFHDLFTKYANLEVWENVAPFGVNEDSSISDSYWLPNPHALSADRHLDQPLLNLWNFCRGYWNDQEKRTLGICPQILNYFEGWRWSNEMSLEDSENFADCDCCNERHNREDLTLTYDNEILVCGSCSGSGYWFQGDLYWHEENLPNRVENSQHYKIKPSPVFFGSAENKAFFGLELETEFEDSGWDPNSLAQELHDNHWKNEGLWYWHFDGSLDNGVEFVSHPMSADYFRNELDLGWLDYLRGQGLRSWNTTTCGIHIHTSRAGFESDVHLFAFARLIYLHRTQWQQLAGRESNGYASFNLVDRAPLALDIKKKSDTRNRYVAVNLTPNSTVEVRIFRGSLNPRRVRSALELISSAVEFTRGMTIRDLNLDGLNWSRFVEFLESTNCENALYYINQNDLKGVSNVSSLLPTA